MMPESNHGGALIYEMGGVVVHYLVLNYVRIPCSIFEILICV